MRKGLKAILWIVGTVALIVLIFWICIVYVTNYKKTNCDTSISPDGKYELTLQAVGEPDWPFGSASGQLVLSEGKDKISEMDFELQNDGKSINSSCWKVTWYEDYVEIILSGEEQFDEQVFLYFGGRKEIRQLTDTDDKSESKGEVFLEDGSEPKDEIYAEDGSGPEDKALPEDYGSIENISKYSTDWQESQILQEIDKRKPYRDSCSFYPEFLYYMENVREVRDISVCLEPLYATATEYYQASDFDGAPPLIIYLAKNEIYARHGYTFKDTDLNSYFLSQLWYLPEFDSENFDTSVFNEYETANLQLLAQLDTYK